MWGLQAALPMPLDSSWEPGVLHPQQHPWAHMQVQVQGGFLPPPFCGCASPHCVLGGKKSCFTEFHLHGAWSNGTLEKDLPIL